MRQWSNIPEDLPPLNELGADLMATSARQRWIALSRPFLCVAFCAVAAYFGWWVLMVVGVALLFVTIVSSAHDLVHQVLGLHSRWNDVLLSVIGMLVLESGHAYQISHLQHHRRFPLDDDPEGDPAHMSFWRSLLKGPVFLFRLWIWAWQRAPRKRGWLALEAAWFCLFLVASISLLPLTPAFLIYAVLVIMGSWVYPISTVHLPHNAEGENALTQTYTLRGRIIPKLFLELTYHLEHHLYPAVPSHHYAELAERLEPYFARKGVEPVRVL